MKTNMKKVFVVLYAMLALASFSVVSAAKQEASPDWVKNLPQAKTAKQLFVVAGVGKTTAWVSMHEKDTDGNWRILMTTPGFLGKEGLEKTKGGLRGSCACRAFFGGRAYHLFTSGERDGNESGEEVRGTAQLP